MITFTIWFYQLDVLRAIPFEYTWRGEGGGGVERSPIKKYWGEGVKIKKIIGRGVCQILKYCRMANFSV